MTPIYVLDSWAVLAYLKKETPADLRVRDLLEQAGQGKARLLLSLINLGEIYYTVGRARGAKFAESILAEMRLLPIEILPVDEGTVFAAARWKVKHAISYADAFAVATAEQNQAVLLTGDPELLGMRTGPRIERLQRLG